MKLLTRVLLSLTLISIVFETRSAENETANLPMQQRALAERFKKFEATLQQMSDLLRRSDPDRSSLLLKAHSLAKRELLTLKLNELAEKIQQAKQKAAGNLQGDVLADVIREQEEILVGLNELMELLLSEDRAKRMRELRERIEAYLQDIRKLERQQKDIEGQTQRLNGKAPTEQDQRQAQRLAEQQAKLADRTKQLMDQIENQEKQAGNPNPNENAPEDDPENQSPQNPEGKNEDQKNDPENKNPDDPNNPKSDESPEPSDSDAKSPENAPKSENQPQPANGKPKESSGQPQTDQPQQQQKQLPGTERVAEAERAMREAQQKLEKLQKEEATEEQKQAVQKLQQAIAELEELLRQLREEEKQEILASLEQRLRRLLNSQQVVLDSTVRLDQTPAEKRTRTDERNAIALADQEKDIREQINQTLLVLRDDGTAVALPIILEEVRNDVDSIIDRLSKADVSEWTQGIERDVVEALKQMLDMVQQEQRRQNQPRPPQQQQPQEGEQKNPLLNKLAEIKMIRSMQTRVLQRTERLASLYDGFDPNENQLRQRITELARQQERLYEIAREIALEAQE